MISSAAIATSLRDAAQSRTPICIHRSPRHADAIDAVVLAVGPKWVLLDELVEGGYFDERIAVRLKDVSKVRRARGITTAFAPTRPEWPPTAPDDIGLTRTGRLILSLGSDTGLIGIEQEHRFKKSGRWIGVATEAAKGWLGLHQLSVDGEWYPDPLYYKLSRITKVIVGGRYQTALATVAETPWPPGA